MRWNLTSVLQTATLVLLVAPLVDPDEVLGNDLSFGPESGLITNDYCQGDCGLVCECEPQTRYSLNANLLWLGRDKVDPNFLIVAPAGAPAFSLLHTSQLEFNVEAGIEMGIRAQRQDGQTWELRYFGIFDQLAHVRRTYDDGDADTTNDAAIRQFGEDLGSYTDLTTAYSSDLHSGEVNVWLSEWWRFEPVVGFRWVRQNEDLETFVTTDLNEGALVEFANNLYGVQAGLRGVLWETPSRCRVEAMFKGGLYYNDMKFDGEYRTGGGVVPSFNESFVSTALGGELTITASYRITRNLSFNIGYTGLWLDGVGLAADQLDNFDAPSGTGDVDLTTLIYQGGHFGLELAW